MDKQCDKNAWKDPFGMFALRSLQALIVLAFLVVITIGLLRLSSVFIPLVIAVILASGFAPILHYLRSESDNAGYHKSLGHRAPNKIQKVMTFFIYKRPNMSNTISTIVALLGFGGVLGFTAWGISSNIQGQWNQLYASIISGIDDLIYWVKHLPFDVDMQKIEEIKDQVFAFLGSSQFGDYALSGLGSVVSFATSFVLLVVMLFFFMKDGEKIWKFILLPFSTKNRERGTRLGRASVETFGQYIRGASIVAAVDSLFIWIALVILGVPLALSLAVLTFLLSFIPFVGATLGGALAALVALVSGGPVTALIVVIVIIVINQLEGNFLQPVVMGRSLSLHPLVVFLALIIGTSIAGIVGAVLSVPLAAMVWKCLNVWNGENSPVSWLGEKKNEEIVVNNDTTV